MLHTIVLIAHVFLALCMVALILLQRGKGADAGAAFGAGASGTVFGASGSANFLSRTTAVLATLFFVTSLSLAFLGGRPTQPRSLLEETPAATQPAQESDDELPSLREIDATEDSPPGVEEGAPQEP
ncbi:preprotein translocase subunit SecG [soil metagenome]